MLMHHSAFSLAELKVTFFRLLTVGQPNFIKFFFSFSCEESEPGSCATVAATVLTTILSLYEN